MPARAKAPLLAGLTLLLVLAAACGGGSKANSEPSGESVNLQTSNVTRYYSVYGTNTEAIFAYIRDHGPTDAQGRRGNGLTSVEWSYEWQRTNARNACSIASMTISVDLVVILPRHEELSSLTSSISSNWKGFTDGVAAHEQKHVDIYLAGADRIKSEMEAIGTKQSCEELEQVVTQTWDRDQAQINADQDAFHTQEDARIAAQRSPLQSKIDSNRSRLTLLSGQVNTLDSQIADLRAQLDTINAQLGPIRTEMGQIEQQYPNVNDRPGTVRSRYETLAQQYNALTTSYNAIVPRYNDALGLRTSLANDYQSVVADTNSLVDQFNWTR